MIASIRTMSAVFGLTRVEGIGDADSFQGLKSQGVENNHPAVASPETTAAKAGSPKRIVTAILAAKNSTAVSSSIPETGNTRYANDEKPSYASGSELTRSMQPTWSSSRLANISRVLKRRMIPQKCGRIRGPIEKTMVAANPTVSAWRDAPQIPPCLSSQAAQTLMV